MTDEMLRADRVGKLFQTEEGDFRFARWGRSIAPVVFGMDDTMLDPLKDAMSAVAGIAGLQFSETDPELGANFMIFVCRNWDELALVPDLDKLVPNFSDIMAALKNADASQYRTFFFDDDGAIQMCVSLLRFGDEMAGMSVQALGTAQMLQAILLWGAHAFDHESPIAFVPETSACVVKPGYAALLRAAYDRALPRASRDASLALRLAARAGKSGAANAGATHDA